MVEPVCVIIESMTEHATNDDKTRLISLKDAANIYGFSRHYLNNLAKVGRLNAQKVGNMWVTTPADVEEYIRSRQKRGDYRDDIQVDSQ